MDKYRPIGVFDTGVGGFSTVRELRKILPAEDIVYYGDSANMPYGNKSAAEILRMTRQILQFMAEQNVKAAAVACNTISTLIDEYRDDYPFKIFSIVEAGASCAAALGGACVGVIGTVFTARSGAYSRLINAAEPRMKVVTAGCPDLARLIDSGCRDQKTIDAEIRRAVDEILEQAPVTHLILGCTHYSLVTGDVRRLYPQIALIDPACEQAAAVKRWLEGEKLLNDAPPGKLRMYTDVEPQRYSEAVKRFGLKEPEFIRKLMVVDPA